MAVVFRAVDERLGRRVALKVLVPALAADPHIIPVYEAGQAGDLLFIAMRYVHGGDVRTLLHRHSPATMTLTALTPYAGGKRAYADMVVSAPEAVGTSRYRHLVP